MTVTNDIENFQNVLDLCRQFSEEVLENLQSREFIYDYTINEVENKSRDGFVAFTDGGFDGIGYADLRSAWGSGDAPKVIQPYIDRDLEECKTEWDEQNPEHTYEWIFDYEANENERKQMNLAFVESYHPTKRECWQEKYWDFENEWLSEGGTYFYKARVLFFDEGASRNVSGEPEAYFMVGINTDFEYGRDYISWAGGSQTDWVWEKNVPVKDLTPDLIESMIEEATSALETA